MKKRMMFGLGPVLAILAAGALLVSAAWCLHQETAIRQIRVEPVAVRPNDSVYAPVLARPSPDVTTVWPAPVPQSRGDGWCYDLFTPPEIMFSPATRSLTVRVAGKLVVPGEPWKIELLGVKYAPYPVQLTGYFGGPADYLVAFAATSSPEILLARAGERIGKFDLRLREFSVKKLPVPGDDGSTGWEVVAQAVVHDEATRVDVVLDSRQLTMADTLLAVCQGEGPRDLPGELRAGDTLAVGGSAYRVDRIQLNPPSATFTRTAYSSAASESRTLYPPDTTGAAVTVAPTDKPLELTRNNQSTSFK